MGAIGGSGYLGFRSHRSASSRPHPHVLVIGHAGSGFLSPVSPFNPLPPNSMGSIKKAFEDGADGVEVDVQLSKDNTPILYHDVLLDSFTDAAGLIDTLPAARVLGLPYRAGFPYEPFQHETIISLEQLLKYLGTRQELSYLQLDLRNRLPEHHPAYVQTVLRLLAKYNYPLPKVAFISPDVALLEQFRTAAPTAVLLLDAEGDFEGTRQKVLQHRFQGFVIASKVVQRAQVQQAKQQGLQVILFGGRSASAIAGILDKGPDAIEVNNVRRLRKLLE